MSEQFLSLPSFLEALLLAADKHQYQRRSGYDRLPYINHLIKVVDALLRIGHETDPELLLAGLLHDIIEDTDVTEEDLSRRFSPKVGRIVAELTDDMSLPYAVRKQRQVEGAASLSPEARKIRIADKACNIRDILHYPIQWTLEKKQNYVTNACDIVHQIRGVNGALEAWFDSVVAEARHALNMEEKKGK